MKGTPLLATLLVVSMLCFAVTVSVQAGTVEEVKEGSKQAAKEIKEDAVETGKDIRDGSKKVWKDVKEGAKQVGEDFKKAYQDTRDAIREEISGEGNQTEAPKKDTPQK